LLCGLGRLDGFSPRRENNFHFPQAFSIHHKSGNKSRKNT
jgi:hypothetical protein